MHTNTKEFWDNQYKKNQTGWDLGNISTPLKEYFDQIKNKSTKILVPGAGNAHEVAYLHNNGFDNVFLLDWSEKAIENFKQNNPNFDEKYLLCKDFFELDNKFELIIEQTFFCALPPTMRSDYIAKMHELLTENGKLVGLLFNIPLNSEHPPYGGNKSEYESLFENKFDFKILDAAYNSIKPRAGSELFFIAKKKAV
ncbi:MAG: methyltransferase domain-containing protein [Chitinophagales bacterium]|nr:methyltransferase domain-containing protein [Chitinophagales bacterium]